VASAFAASSSSRLNTSPGVSKFEMENQMEVSVALTCSGVEMEAMNSEVESCEHDLAEAIAGQNKRISVLEQGIVDLKSQLQNAQRQLETSWRNNLQLKT